MPYASATMDSSSCCSNLWVARQSAPARMNWDTIIRSYSMHSASQEVTGSNRFIGAYSALTREVKKSKIWIEGETYLFQIYIRQWIMSLMTFNPRNLPSFIFSDAFQYFCRFTWSNNKKIIICFQGPVSFRPRSDSEDVNERRRRQFCECSRWGTAVCSTCRRGLGRREDEAQARFRHVRHEQVAGGAGPGDGEAPTREGWGDQKDAPNAAADASKAG